MANYPQTTSSAFTGDITLTNGGKAGIGTTAPAEALDVAGNAAVRRPSWTSDGDTANVYLGDSNHYIKGVHGDGVRIGTYGATDAITLKQNSGNVGIGLATPDCKLDVNGAIAIKDSLTAPMPVTGKAFLYVEDGSLKVKFGNGVVKTIATH